MMIKIKIKSSKNTGMNIVIGAGYSYIADCSTDINEAIISETVYNSKKGVYYIEYTTL